MNARTLLITALAATILSACATTQRTFDSSTLSQIQDRKSTREDVRRLLGEPESVHSSAGDEMWTYTKRGRTTGNELTDHLRSGLLAGPFGISNMQENLLTHDIVIVHFKKGVVSEVERDTGSKNFDRN